MTNDKFNNLFGQKRRNPQKDKITQFHMDIAASIQKVTEEIILKLAKAVRERGGYTYHVKDHRETFLKLMEL